MDEADAMAACMGFASFGKRKRSPTRERAASKVRAPSYVPDTIDYLASSEASAVDMVLDVSLATTESFMPRLAQALEKLLERKTSLENLAISPATYRRCRGRANPYEHLGKFTFVNRSAIKMAELNARCGLTSTSTKSFADLCGAPGGFSEYLVYCTESARGYGISIRPDADDDPLHWRLDDATQARLDVSYGADGTGDLYVEANMDRFVETALHENPQGLDLVVADGGFQEARNHVHQEHIMHHLVLCEVLTMTRLLRTGGHFVCKTFELSTPFSLGLLYLLYRTFTQLAIVKPITSRPGSSERYIVGLGWKTYQPKALIAHLGAANHAFASGVDVVGLVASSQWRADTTFLDYVEASGVTFASRQILALDDILATIQGHAPRVPRVHVADVYATWQLR
ncbi:hypothetical protein SDRG_07395 [Saprolegnia diclina VS20]|uniref:Cap-specific mRNA (nucleoside-2'-O-)-methyltransferase 1 n=1 Tax=Saprolegnia diclina (strain VS20) TaxID=1156394 RepID=T0RRP5_SAPDV|nr:hypothetical protein SDRG_07395 [Saprolegnia diclina VS20]EQC35163.1 hypothetical protein SDRG_07395 [Saprolegnia diclina VS20]|eukprot:XP_008611447.1 hypothetical protein SDRG_07395 [Saprolegnia diclina VS20]